MGGVHLSSICSFWYLYSKVYNIFSVLLDLLSNRSACQCHVILLACMSCR